MGGKKKEKRRIWPSLLEVIIIFCNLEKKFSKSDKIGPIFPLKNPLYKLKSYFSGQNLANICQ
jgi:hypothetical protein